MLLLELLHQRLTGAGVLGGGKVLVGVLSVEYPFHDNTARRRDGLAMEE